MIYYSLKIVTSQNQFITVLYIYNNIYKTKYNNTNKNNNLSKYFITKAKKTETTFGKNMSNTKTQHSGI